MAANAPLRPGELKTLRETTGMNQTQAGQCMWVTRQTWCNWENGRTAMPRYAFEYFKIRARAWNGNV